MKMTIRNKLIAGFSGVLVLMGVVAANASVAFLALRHSAHEATTVGGRLNSTALEIQVHNLEAQRRIKNYLDQVGSLGAEKAGEMYLGEARFEIHEIRTLAAKASAIAPDPGKRAKFEKISQALSDYEKAVDAAVSAASAGRSTAAAIADCETAAESLHEFAEDGEVAGREASQASEDDIKRVSDRALVIASVVSLFGLILGMVMSALLTRAILTPVNHLREVADNVSMGNLAIEVQRHSSDEIGDLADSFGRMLTAVKFFRMEAEYAQQDAIAALEGKQ